MEKIIETLEALLKAFESKITPKMVLPKNLQKHQNPIQKRERLVKHSSLIHDTQTILEGPQKKIEHSKQLVSTLEPIAKDRSLRMDQSVLIAPYIEPRIELEPTQRINSKVLDNQDIWKEIRTSKY